MLDTRLTNARHFGWCCVFLACGPLACSPPPAREAVSIESAAASVHAATPVPRIETPSSPVPIPGISKVADFPQPVTGYPWDAMSIPMADAGAGLMRRQSMLEAIAEAQASNPVPPREEVSVDPEALEAVEEEMAALRDEVTLLREELRSQNAEIVAALKRENDALRDELTRIASSLSLPADSSPTVPSPKGSAGLPVPEPTVPATSAPVEPKPAGKPSARRQPFVFTSVKEWGRSPEEAAGRGTGVASLKGMVGTVPSDSTADDLKELGLKLRKQYENFDNINIEVFNSKDAARAYAETQAIDKEHRVLSVSRHAQSGRDAVFLYEGGREVDILPR